MILLSIIGFCIGAIGATLRAGIWIVVLLTTVVWVTVVLLLS